jgi:hypothetical protein
VLLSSAYDGDFLQVLLGRPRFRMIDGRRRTRTLRWKCGCAAKRLESQTEFLLNACPRHAVNIHLAGNSLSVPRRTRRRRTVTAEPWTVRKEGVIYGETYAGARRAV